MRRADSLEKTLLLGKIEGKKRRRQQKMKWLDGITDWMYMNLSKLRKTVKVWETWRVAVHGVARSRTWLATEHTCTHVHVIPYVSVLCFLSFPFCFVSCLRKRPQRSWRYSPTSFLSATYVLNPLGTEFLCVVWNREVKVVFFHIYIDR